jgi:hypothetical protein
MVEGPAFADRVLIAFESGKEQTLRSADGEIFTFRDHGLVRVTAKDITVRGQVSAFRVRAAGLEKLPVTVNGKQQPARRLGRFLTFGKLVLDRDLPAKNPAEDEPRERRASVHYAFAPEEVHVRAGNGKETVLHLYCTGEGKTRGRLRLVAPKGITVEPAAVDVAGMSAGDEKVLRLRVKAEAGAANALHAVRMEPADGAMAATKELLVSVGVVITEDKRIPLAAQTVIRAPGYTMKVDQLSGVSYYLLDADGHRRHGRIHNTNFCYGLGAVARNGRWALRYGDRCRFVWEGKNTLTIVSGNGQEQVRLRYTFHEDRLTLALVPPTDPKLTYTMWLGNFDALGAPRHEGTQKQSGGLMAGSWFFFPHPVHKQGVLLQLPPKTPVDPRGSAVHFPVRSGQAVVLRFAEVGELPRLVNHKASADKPK